jgi:pimeloyl-ACP methyl ester carboxylesterase
MKPEKQTAKDKYENSPDRLVAGAAGCGSILLALGGVIGGWLTYSLFRVNHEMDIPPALNAERYTFISPTAGTLSYYADREVQGAPLVLLHSINASGSAYEMRPLFDRLRDSRPVYALDWPGFGFSDRAKRKYTPQLYAQALIDFIEKHVHRHPADVVALSLGSEFAALAAQQRPDLFRSLTFISPSGFDKRQNKPNREARQERLYRTLSFPFWSQAFYDLLVSRRSIRWFLKKSFVGKVDPGLENYDYLTAHRPGAKNAPLYFVSGKLRTPRILDEVYNQLSLPVHVLYDRDAYLRFDRLEEMLSKPNWSATRITPTLGLPHFEKLDQTEAALVEFWSKV